MSTIAILLGTVGVGLALALGLGLYTMIRGEYLHLPTDKPGTEVDALTRLLGSFARFSVRSRRIIRALAAALVLDFLLSGAFGYLAYEFEAQRCVPYRLIDHSNAGIRHFLTYTYSRAVTAPFPLTQAQRAQLHGLRAEESRDFPRVACP